MSRLTPDAREIRAALRLRGGAAVLSEVVDVGRDDHDRALGQLARLGMVAVRPRGGEDVHVHVRLSWRAR